jgi:hypothetical protein
MTGEKVRALRPKGLQINEGLMSQFRQLLIFGRGISTASLLCAEVFLSFNKSILIY